MTTCRKPETVQACFTPSNNSPSVSILHTTLFDASGKAFSAYYHDEAGNIVDPSVFMGGGVAKIGAAGSILPKKQCWEVPGQVLIGTNAAPFVIVAGDLEIVSQGGQGNALGPFVNTAGGLEFSIDGTTFGTWGNTVGGNGNQAVIDQDPLYIRNPTTGTTVPFDITALTGGGSPTYAATATIASQSFNVTVYPDNTTVTCDSLGNEVTLPADAVQIECPSEFEALQEIRDLVSAIRFGGIETCFEMPNTLGQNTAPNRFEDLSGAGANVDISTDMELDIPEDGVLVGFALTLNSLTPAVPAPPTDTVISLLVNGISTNTVSTIGGVFTHRFMLDTPVPVSQGDFITIQVVPEAGGIPSDVFYLPANTTQNAFLQGSNVRPMLTVIAEGFETFSKVTYADKSEQFFDGDGDCIDELPPGLQPCAGHTVRTLRDIDGKLQELIDGQISDLVPDPEHVGPICYEVPSEPVQLQFSSGDGVNSGNGVINYEDLNGTGIGAVVTSSTGSIVLQSIGPLFNFNGDGTITLEFSEPITIGEMTVRSSAGVDALYSNFSVPPISASAGFELDSGAVIVADGETAPVDGIIDFGGVEVTEISFDVNQNESTTHINNIAGVERRPERRQAVACYRDGALIEHRDIVTDALVDPAQIVKAPLPDNTVSLTPECKQELAEAIAKENAKCATAQYSEKQFPIPNSLVNLFNFAANADDTIDNAVVNIADIEAFFDNFDYGAAPSATSTQGDFSIADFVGGAGTESNASFVEGYINVTGPMFIRMQNTNNWSGRVDLGENCGEYENILTHYNGPGQAATSLGAPIPLGVHRIRVSSWDYDGANGNINTQFSITGTNGWTTDAAGVAGLEFSNIAPTDRCFMGRVCEGSDDIIEVSTGLIVDGAELFCPKPEPAAEPVEIDYEALAEAVVNRKNLEVPIGIIEACEGDCYWEIYKGGMRVGPFQSPTKNDPESVDATLAPSAGKLVSDFFSDGNLGPFSLQLRNTTSTPINWQATISNVPYSTIPNLSGPVTLDSSQNPDGTYQHLLTGTGPIAPFANAPLNGDTPNPVGNGTGLELFCEPA